MTRIHKKTWPKYFQMVADGTKTFDFRLADFDCQPGDVLVMEEWDPKTRQYTGRVLRKDVVSVIRQKDLEVWPEQEAKKHGYFIISLGPDQTA
jgi:hypothetical protein